MAVRLIWHVRVDLFFEAVALFGGAALAAQGESSRDGDRRFRGGVTLAVALTLLAVIAMNVALILNLSRAQSDEIGNTQLDVIRSDLQDTITEAETQVLRVAIGAEQLMESGASREALSDYFVAQRDKYLSDDDFMNVYIAGRDWHIIPDFDAPKDFHASERVWYIGAQDCPGEVYISEPYVDASTGDMCFTVSTLLSDGETVVGMDLNFSKAQESILRMTRGRDQTAMIVTSGGLIASAEEARSANRAKSQFLSQMSHEIRTPMNAIIGLDSIALREGDLPPRTREALEMIGSSARHLLSLINDILDMSRIESGRMTLREDRFSFRDFMEQICVIVGGQCEDKGLRFVCNRVEPLDECFVGDDLKLKQVLINILGNSVKFTEAPGVITLTVAQTDRADGRAALRFTMEDTGIGMDKEFIPRLFEAFSQEDTSNTNQYGGSGLGMAITRSIVEMMGGEIGVESEKGLGTTFTVTVALGRVAGDTPPEAPAQAAEVPAGASFEGRHVLIAEDQPLNAEVLTDLLEMEDVTCEWAENGQKAVEMFEQSAAGHFDAILMDMRMPVMDGLTTAREIRKLSRPDAATIPIVTLTANAFEEDVRQCLEAGMNAHLSKPVDIDKLKETLGRLI